MNPNRDVQTRIETKIKIEESKSKVTNQELKSKSRWTKIEKSKLLTSRNERVQEKTNHEVEKNFEKWRAPGSFTLGALEINTQFGPGAARGRAGAWGMREAYGLNAYGLNAWNQSGLLFMMDEDPKFPKRVKVINEWWIMVEVPDW